MENFEKYVLLALSVVGAAQLVVQGLEGSIAGLEKWAAKTDAKWDDNLVGKLASGLRALSKLLKVCGFMLKPLAARNPKKP